MGPAPRLPPALTASSALPILNVVAVGLALAAATVASLRFVLGGMSDLGSALETGGPTFGYAVVWHAVLRRKAGAARPWGLVVASAPFAVANAATACGLRCFNGTDFRGFLAGAMAGATLGAIIWVPALLATVVCFGLPLSHAQTLAKKGLAGEERGEMVVAIMTLLVALGALALLRFDHAGSFAPGEGSWKASAVAAALGGVTALAAFIAAARRGSARRAFVRAVEAGGVEGYRVDATAEGKVLVRVASVGTGYRRGTVTEPVVGLEVEDADDEDAPARATEGGRRAS